MKPVSRIYPAASLAALVAVATGAAWSAAAPKSGILEYEMQMKPTGSAQTQPGTAGPQTVKQTIYFKGQMARLERSTSIGTQVVIHNAEGMYFLRPSTKEAMKMPRRPRTGGGIPGMPSVDQIRKQKKVGSEKIGPYMTDIYDETRKMSEPGAPEGQVTTRYWVSAGLPAPVKAIDKTSTTETTIILKSAKLNVPVADSMFQIPKGTKIQEIPASGGRMGGGMPGQPGAPGPPPPK